MSIQPTEADTFLAKNDDINTLYPDIEPGKFRWREVQLSDEEMYLISKAATNRNIMPDKLIRKFIIDGLTGLDIRDEKLSARIELYMLLAGYKDRQQAARSLSIARNLAPKYGEEGDSERLKQIGIVLGLESIDELPAEVMRIVEYVIEKQTVTLREIGQYLHYDTDERNKWIEIGIERGYLTQRKEGKSRIIQARQPDKVATKHGNPLPMGENGAGIEEKPPES